MMRTNVIALFVREVVIGDAEHIHLNPSGHESNRRPHMLGDTRRGVQRDSSPDLLNGSVVDAVVDYVCLHTFLLLTAAGQCNKSGSPLDQDKITLLSAKY